VKLYLAAIYTNRLELTGAYYARMTPHEQRHRREIRNILESYHYVGRESYVRAMRRDGARVFLDSGAFSAFTLGKDVDLDAYCRYCRDNADLIEFASVLDGIGDPQKTYENQCAMEANGVQALPCFHYGEDERFLEYYVERYPYITLGGMVPIARPQLKLWLDRIWHRYLTDGQGRPKLKVHGFGLTTMSLMKRYPWHSVDSSSWVQIGNVGNVLFPEWGIVPVSPSSPKAKIAGQHADTVTTIESHAVRAAIEKRGFEWERIRKEYVSRWIFNCAAYREVQDTLNQRDDSFELRQPLLFP
jgi:hypothetical protein